MRHVFILLALGWLVHAVTSFRPHTGEASDFAGVSLAFGALLLAALFCGRLAVLVRLPKLVAYILAGVAAGPHGLGFVSEEMVTNLGLVNGIAICLIALIAGSELNIRRMRPLLGVIARLSLFAVVGTCVLLGFAVFGMSALLLPFLDPYDGLALVAVAATLGIALCAQSPAVVTAMITEARADGPVSRVMLGTVVIADLVIIVLFGVASALVQMSTGGDADAGRATLAIAWELFGSMGVGALVGGILALHGRFVRRDAALVVLIVCVVVSEVGRRVHLDPLIVMLTAGVVLENATKDGAATLVHDLEEASLPVFLVFFAVAGATLHLAALATVGVPAVILASVRAGGFWAGARLATRGADSNVRRWAFTGLLPQAGLALALAMIIKRMLPIAGDEAATLVLAVIAINELAMPLLVKHALVSAGETGRRPERAETDAADHGAEPAPRDASPAEP